MNIKILVASLLILSMISSGSWAKVSIQEASQLGDELTQMGALKAGNSAGSIPRYTGGLPEDKNANPMENTLINEKPLFTITSKNIGQYQNQLTDGQIALFEKYPDSYKMPIYKTHRTASYPESIYKKAESNAITTQLASGGNGMVNFDEAVPFVIPKSGLEVIWNHISRYRGGAIERNSATIPVQVNGGFVPVKVRSKMSSPHYLSDGYDPEEDENILYYFTQVTKSPARLGGNVLLVHETIDQVNQPRMAWNYNAGQRRVRRAPQVGYDAPVSSAEDLRTSDQTDMFNGAPNKYEWNLVGKKEMYIPYNSYKLADPSAKYSELVRVGHLNQDYTRYELHRVWQVEATLKKGERHLYGKRTFYIDEDSWQIAIADHFDNRGQLWRVAEGHALQFVNANALWYASNTSYDLFSGRYLVTLNNEENDPFVFNKDMKRKDFSTSAIRRQGKR